MSSQTDNLLLTLPADGERLSLGVLNQNWQKIDGYVGTENLGTLANLTALESALDTIGASMRVRQSKSVWVQFSANSSPFSSTGYGGTMYKVFDNRYRVFFMMNANNFTIEGSKTANGWIWESTISRMTQKIVNIGSYAQTTANAWEDTGITIVVPSGHLYVGMLTAGYVSGRPLGIGADRSASPSGGIPEQSAESANGQYSVAVFLYPGTWRVFTKRASVASSANNYYLRYVDMFA